MPTLPLPLTSQDNPPNSHTHNDGSHTGIPNEVADIFVVALTFYALVAAIFGASNLHHRHAILHDTPRIRWYHVLVLFCLGWAWPVFCCWLCRGLFGEQGRRRVGEEGRRRRRRGAGRGGPGRREGQGQGQGEGGDGGVELEGRGQQDTGGQEQGDQGEEARGGLWGRFTRRFMLWGRGVQRVGNQESNGRMLEGTTVARDTGSNGGAHGQTPAPVVSDGSGVTQH